jgi:hypothetical protein
MSESKKSRRLIGLLVAGKCIAGKMKWLDPRSHEPGITTVNLCPFEGKYRLTIEQYLERHVLSEDLYIRDELLVLATLDDAVARIEELGIPFDSMHA